MGILVGIQSCILNSFLTSDRMVAIVVGFCFFLIFFFVPETFWDRTPRPRGRSHKRSSRSQSPGKHHFKMPHLPHHHEKKTPQPVEGDTIAPAAASTTPPLSPASALASPRRPPRAHRVGFAPDPEHDEKPEEPPTDYFSLGRATGSSEAKHTAGISSDAANPQTPGGTSASAVDIEKQGPLSPGPLSPGPLSPGGHSIAESDHMSFVYTDHYRAAPPKSYVQSLKPWNGRLTKDKWIKVMVRPFILLAYPAVLWSSMVYSLAVGWLIVLSESVSVVYKDRDSYNFTSLQVGLVYISPFIGGVLGTAVAGKVSDIIVRYMARKNDGIYEPEFRLVMALPIALSTTIGLMGFGWSAEEKDAWIVPTFFFGMISFGCSLASTTAVTFVVDSYRIYAGEALVTLNFCKSKLFTVSSEPAGTDGIQIFCTASSSPCFSPIG